MTTEGTQTDAPDMGTAEPTATDDTATEKDWQAEYEKLQRNSRKWETRAKENANAARELEELRRQTLTDQEKAVADAAEAARAETLAKVGTQLVAAEVRVATAGRSVDADALLDGIDPAKFLGDDGAPDRDAIAAWIDRVAPAPTETNGTPATAAVDLGQGARGGQPADTALGSDPLYQSLKATLGI